MPAEAGLSSYTDFIYPAMLQLLLLLKAIRYLSLYGEQIIQDFRSPEVNQAYFGI